MRRIREENDPSMYSNRVQTENEEVDTTNIRKSEKAFSFVHSPEVRNLFISLLKKDLFIEKIRFTKKRSYN